LVGRGFGCGLLRLGPIMIRLLVPGGCGRILRICLVL